MAPAANRSAQILEILCEVPDPEIPVVSIVDLGIVSRVDHCDQGETVVLTPTYTGCPATEVIFQSVRAALDDAGFGDVGVKVSLTPAWSTSMITPEGHEKLRRYGIAPPTEGMGPVACPHCGSIRTHEVSRFGSTPCKALWLCHDCLEPFDRFKCH